MASEADRVGLTPTAPTLNLNYIFMTGTELAINLGFIVTKEGKVFLKDKEYASKLYGKRSLSFYFRNNNKNIKRILGNYKHIKNSDTKH